jgi:hypothetical protein
VVIPVVACLLVKACQSIHPPNRRSTLKFNRNRTVAADDFMPSFSDQLFSRSARHGHQDNLYQDNQSAILLEKNGRKSSSKRTKHLNCRFHFITDRISNELSVEYCPTEEEVGDFSPNPCKANSFTSFCKLIMNLQDSSTLLHQQECVGKSSISYLFPLTESLR